MVWSSYRISSLPSVSRPLVSAFRYADAPLVAAFVHWLYHGWLPIEATDWCQIFPEDQKDLDIYNKMFLETIKAYAFSIRFVVPPFGRALVPGLNYLCDGYEWSDARARKAITYAFDNIPADRIVLERLVENYCFNCSRYDKDYSLAAFQELPAAFARRVMMRFLEMKNIESTDQDEERCYIEHSNDAEEGRCIYQHMNYDAQHDVAHFV